MPNLPYMFVQLLFLGALALWTGGVAVLGFIAGPVLFLRLADPQARWAFDEMARQMGRLALGCAGVAASAGAARFVLWETAHPFALARYGALALMAGLLLYQLLRLEPRIAALDGRAGPSEEARGRLYRWRSSLLAGQLVLGLMVLFLA